jgi:hypothetical protein
VTVDDQRPLVNGLCLFEADVRLSYAHASLGGGRHTGPQDRSCRSGQERASCSHAGGLAGSALGRARARSSPIESPPKPEGKAMAPEVANGSRDERTPL